MAGHSKWANIQHRKGKQDKLRSIADGFDHHCVKPLNLQELLRILSQASCAQHATSEAR